MTGKVLKISSNDLYGNVDDRSIRVYAIFEHTKYMNNYVVFSIEGNNKLCYGSIHLKDKSLVIFSVKSDVDKYILEFIDEYINNKVNNFKILDIKNIDKVELVSYSEMEYNNIQLLDDKSIPKVIVKEEIVEEKKPVLGYILILLLILLALGITILYLKPDLFTVKYKVLKCENNIYDNNMELYYDIDKDIKFNQNDIVSSISVIRTYTFLDSNSYYEFKENNNENKYFTNGEGYKYIDEELKLRIFYDEYSVIDDYEEMLTYLNREGFSCVERVYEE